jgi:outer membrane protein TolC
MWKNKYTGAQTIIKRQIMEKTRYAMQLKKWKRYVFLNIAISAFQIGSVFSQDSLSNYLSLAAIHNPDLQAQYFEYLASQEMASQAGSLSDPEMTVGYFLKPKEEIMGNQVADIRLMQMFPWIGTLQASKLEASSMSRAKLEAFKENRNKLELDVKSLYYQLFKLSKEIDYTRESLKILKSFDELAVVQFKNDGSASSNPAPSAGVSNTGTTANATEPEMSGGMGLSNSGVPKTSMNNGMQTSSQRKGLVDVLRIRMDIREQENQLENLSDRKSLLIARFNQYLNRKSNEQVFVPDSLPEKTFAIDTLVLSDSMRLHNPMVNMYIAEQESNQAKITKTRKMGFPMFGLGVDYMILTPKPGSTAMDNGKDMLMPMVTITLPIYRKKYQAMRREAEYQSQVSKEKQEGTINMLEVKLQNALVELKDASRKMDQYRWQINLINQSANILMSSYKTSGSEFEEVLNMQQKLLESKFKLEEARVNYLTALVTIEYLTSGRQ